MKKTNDFISKVILFAALILMMVAVRSDAQTSMNTAAKQTLYIGPVGGMGSSWVNYAPNASTSSVFSGYAGVGLIDMASIHWGWGGQLTLSSEGYKIYYPSSVVSDVPTYLRLPLRAYYFFGSPSDIVRPNLYLGPSFGMKVAQHATTNDYGEVVYKVQNASDFRMFDAGFDGGAGIDIKVSRNAMLNLDLGFYQGLTDAVKDPANNYNPNQNLDLSAGVLFGIR